MHAKKKPVAAARNRKRTNILSRLQMERNGQRFYLLRKETKKKHLEALDKYKIK
jgi:hypothetical protein